MDFKGAQFSGLSKFYDSIYSQKNYVKEMKFIFGHLTKFVDSNSPVLEIGCGTGNFTKMLSETFKYVDAIDTSQNMINIAEKKRLPNVKYHCLDFSDFNLNRKYTALFALFMS